MGNYFIFAKVFMKNYFNLAVVVALLLFVQSCKPKANMVYMSNNNPEQEIAQAKFQGLHIQEGDQLLILVSALDEIAVRPFNINTMTKSNEEVKGTSNATPSEYTVSADGTINFPVLGEVYVKGMTHQQLRADLEGRLTRYLTDPMVSVTLKNFNVSVLGEVKSSGQHTSTTQKLNVFQALALAGDMTDYGDRTKVKLIRAQEGLPDMVVNLDLSSSNITASPYYYLQQNDILYVEPDTNRQIAANSNPNRNLWFQIGSVVLAVAGLVIGLTR